MKLQIESILIIDDNEADNYLHKRVISKSGFTGSIYSCENPMEGLNLLKELATKGTPPDLVILDLNMPMMSGWDLIEKITKLEFFVNSTIPNLAVMTTSINPEDREYAREIKAIKHFLNKPLTEEKFKKLTAD